MSHTIQDPTSAMDYEDVVSRCNLCNTKFKLSYSKKHHCCLCSAIFCYQCGYVSHSRFLPCKVPGGCVCNGCRNSYDHYDHDNDRSEYHQESDSPIFPELIVKDSGSK